MLQTQFPMRSKLIARNSLLTVADTGVSILCSFVTVVLVARIMGPEKLGYYAYVVWLVQIANVVGLFGMPSATRKYVAEFLGKGDVGTARRIVQVTFRLQGITCLVLTALGAVITLTTVQAGHVGYTMLALFSLIPAMLMSIPTNVNSAIEDFTPNVVASMTGTFVHLIAVLIVLWQQWDLMGLSAALLLSRTVDCGTRYYLFEQRFPQYLTTRFGTVAQVATAIPFELRQRMIRFCWQATGLLVLNLVVWDRSEILFLKHFSEIQQVAFYSMSFGVMSVISNLPQAFGWAAGSNLMAQQGRDPKPLPELSATILRFQALIALPLALGMVALSSPFVKVLYGSKYEPAIPVLAIVACFSVSSAFVGAMKSLLIASEKQGFLLKWGILTAIVNLSLDWWLIPAKGAIGAALANGISQTVAAIGVWVFAVRSFKIPMPWKPLLKLGFSAVTMAAVVSTITQFLAPAPATIAGVLVGAGTFVAMLRWTRSFEQADRDRLMDFQQALPPWLRNWYVLGVQMVAS